MHRLRCILATFFAILIVIPACCCASEMLTPAVSKQSCCEGGTKEKQHTACDCAAKTPRIVEKASAPPQVPVFALPEPVLSVSNPQGVVILAPVCMQPEKMDTGPPRWRLVAFQRFLI